MRQDHQLLLQEFSAVQQALAELATIYNDAPVGLAVIGVDFRYQRINARLAQMNGVPVEAHLGRTIREVVPKLADIGEGLVRQVAETGRPIINHEIEGETAAEPGVIRHFVEHWSPITDTDGEVVAVNIVVEEVTAQRRAAEALRASEARLRDVLNSMSDAFLLLDRDFRILQMNHAALKVDGRPFSELAGRTPWEAWPAAAGTVIEAAYRRVMAEQAPVLLEHHYVSDLHDTWLDLSIYPTPEGIAVFFRDISERKRAEHHLQQNESRLATALRAGHLGVFDVTYGAQTVFCWDPTVRRIWGVSDTETITDAFFWNSVHKDDVARLRAMADDVFASPGPRRIDAAYRILRASDQSIRWVNVALDVVSGGGSQVKMIGTVQDITERKLAEEHAQLLMREVNHRSKNLLAVVQSIAHQMARTADPATFAERFSERLTGLASCHDLLVHSQWKGVDLEGLIRSQLAAYRPLIGERIHLHGPALRIAASATQNLGLALHELATNAAKYGALADAAGSVAITWHVSGPAEAPLFHLSWIEQDGPAVLAPTGQGMGTHIITRLLKHAFHAEVDLAFPPEGVRWSITAPAGGLLEEPGTAA